MKKKSVEDAIIPAECDIVNISCYHSWNASFHLGIPDIFAGEAEHVAPA